MFMNLLNNKNTRLNSTLLFAIFLSLFSPAQLVHADQSNPIIIGLDADMSGRASVGGQAIYRGAQIAIDEINGNGGILGQRLELLVKDHKGNPARGIHNIEQFSTVKNLIAVIGGVHTPVALAELQTIHRHQLIYLGAWAAGTGIVENGYKPNYVFRVSLRDSDAGEVMVESAQRRGFSKIALVLERTPWGRSNLNAIQKAANKHNVSITNVSWINWNQTNFQAELFKLTQTKPDAILLVANAPEGATLAKHLIASNNETPIISHWGIAGGEFAELVGKNALKKLDISVLQSFHFDNSKNNPIAKKLLNAYKQKYDTSATSNSISAAAGVAQAYDIVHLLALAVEKAQTINRETIRTQMLLVQKHQGAIKKYISPFKETQDALVYSDYFMAAYDNNAQLSPLDATKG